MLTPAAVQSPCEAANADALAAHANAADQPARAAVAGLNWPFSRLKIVCAGAPSCSSDTAVSGFGPRYTVIAQIAWLDGSRGRP